MEVSEPSVLFREPPNAVVNYLPIGEDDSRIEDRTSKDRELSKSLESEGLKHYYSGRRHASIVV